MNGATAAHMVNVLLSPDMSYGEFVVTSQEFSVLMTLPRGGLVERKIKNRQATAAVCARFHRL